MRGMDGGRSPHRGAGAVPGVFPRIPGMLILLFRGRDHHPREAETEVHGQGAGGA